jgi:hypothetical protein
MPSVIPLLALSGSSLHRKCEAASWGTADQMSSRRDFLILTKDEEKSEFSATPICYAVIHSREVRRGI